MPKKELRLKENNDKDRLKAIKIEIWFLLLQEIIFRKKLFEKHLFQFNILMEHLLVLIHQVIKLSLLTHLNSMNEKDVKLWKFIFSSQYSSCFDVHVWKMCLILIWWFSHWLSCIHLDNQEKSLGNFEFIFKIRFYFKIWKMSELIKFEWSSFLFSTFTIKCKYWFLERDAKYLYFAELTCGIEFYNSTWYAFDVRKYFNFGLLWFICGDCVVWRSWLWNWSISHFEKKNFQIFHIFCPLVISENAHIVMGDETKIRRLKKICLFFQLKSILLYSLSIVKLLI
jgi:hypothetical protein